MLSLREQSAIEAPARRQTHRGVMNATMAPFATDRPHQQLHEFQQGLHFDA
jgi:hypothetical protein